MWFGKWIIGSILLQRNLVLGGINQALMRTSGTLNLPSDFTRIQAIQSNLKVVLNWPFLLFFGGIFIFLMIDFKLPLKGWRVLLIQNRFIITAFVLISFLPIIWLFIFANHSHEHYWFTYRVLSISIFSIYCLIIHMKTSSAEHDIRGS